MDRKMYGQKKLRTATRYKPSKCIEADCGSDIIYNKTRLNFKTRLKDDDKSQKNRV